MGANERGAGGGALLAGPGMGGAGQNSGSHVVLAANDWIFGEAAGAGKRRSDEAEFTDGEKSDRRGRKAARSRTAAIVRIDRPVRSRRLDGLHHGPASFFWETHAGAMGDFDVQASGSSFAAVWSLSKRFIPAKYR